MVDSVNKAITDAVSGLISEGLLILPSCGWVDVEKWIDRNYPKSFFEGRNYREYMESDDWRRERYRQFDIHGRTCEICGSTSNLQVHHISYERGEYPSDYDCAVLCQECHKRLHSAIDSTKSDIDAVELTRRKWMKEVDVFLAHKMAEHINEEWSDGIPGKRKVRAVSIIRNTLTSQNNVIFLPSHSIIAHDLIKGRK